MKESKAKTLECPLRNRPCLGSECMMWTWLSAQRASVEGSSEGEGDCSLAVRYHPYTFERVFASETS